MELITVTMVTGMAITRCEIEYITDHQGWVLLYGRRKVGKTFLVRNFIKHDDYILIKRGGGALFEKGPVKSCDDNKMAMDLIIDRIQDGKTIVIDEFQRLPDEFLDRLQMVHPRGRVLLLGSSMKVAKELLSSRSPLLGLLGEVKMGLLSPSEIFIGLSEVMPAQKALELGTYLRDPWSIPYLGGSPSETMIRILNRSKEAIPALIGEIFLSDERYLSRVYEGILRSLADGKTTLKEVADQLHSRGLIKANDPSLIRQYVLIMSSMDLIQKIPVNNKKGNYYSIRSKIMDLYYYIDEKYGLDLGGMDLAMEVYEERSPRHIESFIGELLAEIMGGVFEYQMDPDKELDILIKRRKKIILAGEVKWSDRVRKKDIDSFSGKVEGLKCKKVLISKKRISVDNIGSLTPEDLLEMAKKIKR